MRQPRRTNRRTVLTTIGAGLVGSTAFTGTTIGGVHTLAGELNAVRDATRKYRGVDIAKADGYGFFGIVPRAGIVYENLVAFEDADDLEHSDSPTLLFYAPSDDVENEEDIDESTIMLAGVEWLVAGRHEDFDADIFDDENANRELEVTKEEGWHVAPGGLSFTGLHAWVHLANPNGVFAGDHPVMVERLAD